MVSPVEVPGFNLFNRPDFADGIKSFREHFGQEVRSKVPEGYTFLGLEKMGILQQNSNSSAQNARPKSTDGRSFPDDQQQKQPAPSSAGSGPSQTRSSNSRVSHPNNNNINNVSSTRAKGLAPPPAKNAKAAVPVHRDVEHESLSTLESLLSYMKRSPKPTSSASRTAGKPEKKVTSGVTVSSSPATKFVKTVVLSEAKSRVVALSVSLPDHISIDMPFIGRLVSLQKGVAKLQAKALQKQLNEKEKQQKLRKQRQQDAVKVSRSKSGILPKDQGKQVRMNRSTVVVVEIERDIKEPRTKQTADIRNKNGNAARDLDPVADIDKGKPSHGQKRSRSPLEVDIRIPKKARRDVIEALSDEASTSSKRLAPVDDLDDETQHRQRNPATKRARTHSKPTQSDGGVEPSSSYSTLPLSPPSRTSNSQSPSRLPKNARSPVSHPRQTALFRDSGISKKATASFINQAKRLSRSRSPPKTRSGSRKRKDALDLEQPEDEATRRSSIKTPSQSSMRDADTKRARDSEKTTPGASQQRAVSRESMRRPLLTAADGSKDIRTNLQASEVEQLRRQSSRLENFMRSFKRSGDAERDPGGRIELEVGHYLESLSCCLEDFWCRRAIQSPLDVSKNWLTMLGICKYLYKRCDNRDLAPLRGCTGLIAACVYYQLLSVSTEMIQDLKEPDRAKQLIADIAQYTKEMETYEQVWRAQLSAHHVSRMFPQTWSRCQEMAPRLGPLETRSNPYMKKWAPVAYPVGATSNPLDVANFVRQIDHEWLSHLGLVLKMPNRKEA
ncbi:hypothetical protein GGI22_005200 [Coemansia erecta]|nr:hypothetical protein GGI22_005200 [Coemansia erecta]